MIFISILLALAGLLSSDQPKEKDAKSTGLGRLGVDQAGSGQIERQLRRWWRKITAAILVIVVVYAQMVVVVDKRVVVGVEEKIGGRAGR